MAIRTEYLRRPALAAEVGARFTGGPNERRTIEIMREILRRAGCPEDIVIHQSRAMGSLFVSHGVMTAILLTLPAPALDLDYAVARELYGDTVGASSHEFEDETFAIILRTYLDGVELHLGTREATAR